MKTLYKRAVGLRYAENEDAPSVSVKSTTVSADEVVRIAHRFGIPVVEKPEMVNLLEVLPVDRPIPERLYRAVAAIIRALSR